MILNLSARFITELIFFDSKVKVIYKDGTVEVIVLSGSLTKLDCSKNSLTVLKGLPASLRSLDCSANHLTKLEGLPRGLRKLWCSRNNLTNLFLPKRLEVLDCILNPLRFIEPSPTPPLTLRVPRNLDTIYYRRYVSHLEKIDALLIYLLLGEDGDYPILEGLEFFAKELWVEGS